MFFSNLQSLPVPWQALACCLLRPFRHVQGSPSSSSNFPWQLSFSHVVFSLRSFFFFFLSMSRVLYTFPPHRSFPSPEEYPFFAILRPEKKAWRLAPSLWLPPPARSFFLLMSVLVDSVTFLWSLHDLILSPPYFFRRLASFDPPGTLPPSFQNMDLLASSFSFLPITTPSPPSVAPSITSCRTTLPAFYKPDIPYFFPDRLFTHWSLCSLSGFRSSRSPLLSYFFRTSPPLPFFH